MKKHMKQNYPYNNTLFPSTVKESNFSIAIEKMTAEETANGGGTLSVVYEFLALPFGLSIAAATKKGICFLAFGENEKELEEQLFHYFPNAKYTRQQSPYFDKIRQLFGQTPKEKQAIQLHLKATPFQLSVWDELLKIPPGRLTTYGEIARQIGNPAASRAVGTAVGQNPVAFLIPCHRVVRSDGHIGGYRWGIACKKAIIAWEASPHGQGQ
jgi:AraC family transcriptional regulator of adaptative response/methylated-DNA-[protein]-cysteine methyltransferase